VERVMTVITRPKALPAEIIRDASMAKQKDMLARHYDRLADAPQTGEKVAATFVPGNLNELIMCFDMVNNLPEVNAIQSGLRKQSGGYVMEAEKAGHSEDVCTYVKSRPRHDGQGQHRPHRRHHARSRPAAAVLHRLLHLHEVVRAAARAVQAARR
jgi:benzoyl-CoA reductase subunit B